MANKDTRIFGYDLIKTFAIFLIVFYHVGGLDFGTISSDEYYLPNLNSFLTSFCTASVPLFFMVNGALILPRHLNLKESLLKASKLFLLFLFGKIVLQYLIADRLFSIENQMVHFWFIGTLGITYLLSYLLNQVKWLRLASLILLLIYPFISNLFFDLLAFIKPGWISPRWEHDGFFTLYALVYFYLGYYLKNISIRPIYTYLNIIIGLFLINFEVITLSNHYQILFDGVNGGFPTIGALLLSIGFYGLFKEITTTNNVLRIIITFIGSNTLGIYLLHVLFIFLLRKYIDIDSINILTSITITCLIICITFFLYHGLKAIYNILGSRCRIAKVGNH